MMPAMSPLMTEGTVTRWKKKEGEAFEAGDVLLEIVSTLFFYFLHHTAQIGPLIFQESEYATIDVQAEKPGIIGKILVRLRISSRLPNLQVHPMTILRVF